MKKRMTKWIALMLGLCLLLGSMPQEAHAEGYKVFFEANGGTNFMSIEQDITGTYTLPVCYFAAPDGKEFAGWSMNAAGPVIEGTTIEVTSDVTLYAIWKDEGAAPEEKLLDKLLCNQYCGLPADPMTGAPGNKVGDPYTMPTVWHTDKNDTANQIDALNVSVTWYKADTDSANTADYTAMAAGDVFETGKYYIADISVKAPSNAMASCKFDTTGLVVDCNDTVMNTAMDFAKTGVYSVAETEVKFSVGFTPVYTLTYTDSKVPIFDMAVNASHSGQWLVVELDETKIPEGKEFDKWEVTPSDTTLSSLTDTTTTVTFGNSNITIKPVYKDKTSGKTDEEKDDDKKDDDKKDDGKKDIDKKTDDKKNTSGKTSDNSKKSPNTVDPNSTMWMLILLMVSAVTAVAAKRRLV